MKKKIGFVDPVGIKAGIDKLDINLAQGFSECGVASIVLSNFDSEKTDSYKFRKVFGIEKFNSITGVIRYFFGIFRSIKILNDEKVSNVIVHLFNSNILTFSKLLLLKISRKKVIVIAHDISSFTGDDVPVFRKIIFNKLCTRIAVHNEHSERELKDILDKEKHSKIYRVDYICPARSLVGSDKKQLAREKLGLDSNKTYMLFFGQIKLVKGLDVVLKAMPYIGDNIELLIAGNPGNNDFKKYQDIIDSLGIEHRVKKWTRFIENEELDLFFSASDISVLPYKKIYQSAVFYDSLSFGVPVISSNLKFFADMQARVSAVKCFNVDVPKDLANLVNEIASNTKEMTLMGGEGREYLINNHSVGQIAKMHLRHLNLG